MMINYSQQLITASRSNFIPNMEVEISSRMYAHPSVDGVCKKKSTSLSLRLKASDVSGLHNMQIRNFVNLLFCIKN